MIRLPVQLRHSERQQRPACAVLLPGDAARHWIKLLREAGVLLQNRVFLPLADPQRSHDIIGAVCPIPAESVAKIDHRISPYGVVAGRVYVPIEAEFDPPLTNADWQRLLPDDDSLFVWHPYLGLIRFERDQQLRTVDLLRSPDQQVSDWSTAVSGDTFNTRLLSLQADALPSLDNVLQSGQEDIGSRSDKQSELPRDPGESKWKSIAAAPLAPFAAMGGWLSKQFSNFTAGMSGASPPRRVSKNLQKQREREIQRLLKKLKDDPDEGLKYALPVSDMPGRGIAPPSGRLGARNVDFSLTSGGGGPVDAWMIRFDLQQQLFARYREAAEREVRLGRYRRAAYIHAQLLGNFAAAANVLEQGQHYHEAAVLYRDKLKRPADAARCLERGGLLHEAIEIYDDLKQHVKVGELYQRLNDTEAAHTAFRRAVDEQLAKEDRISAADLLMKRLGERDEALQILEEGWPDRGQRVQCLKRFFELTAQQGDHARASAKVNEVREQCLSPDRLLDLTSVLSGVATSHTDSNVANRAADATRVVAAKHFAVSPRPSLMLLQSLAKLAPEDKLLQRDCARFGRPPKPAAPPPKVAQPAASRRLGIEHIKSISLARDYEWNCAETAGDHYYLVGHDGFKTLTLLRGLWTQARAQQSVHWTGRGAGGGLATTLLGVDEGELHSVKVVRLDRTGLPPRLLPATSQFFRTTADTPGWIPSNILGMATCGASSWLVDSRLAITIHNREGVTYAHIDLLQDLMEHTFDPSEIEAPLPMHARSDCVYVATGKILHRLTASGPARSLEFPGRIISVCGSLPHTRERILVIHENGASLLFPTLGEFNELLIEDQAPELQGTFLRDGRVVLWSPAGSPSGEIKVYTTTAGRTALQGSNELNSDRMGRKSPPLKLLRTDTANHFAVVPRERGGVIEVWSVPE